MLYYLKPPSLSLLPIFFLSLYSFNLCRSSIETETIHAFPYLKRTPWALSFMLLPLDNISYPNLRFSKSMILWIAFPNQLKPDRIAVNELLKTIIQGYWTRIKSHLLSNLISITLPWVVGKAKTISRCFLPRKIT